jgi:hypothetical protein
MAAAVVEIGCLFVSFFYGINNLFGDGFRSSIISLNSDQKFVSVLSLTFALQMGKRLENTSIKSCFGLIGFIIPTFISFSIWEISMLVSYLALETS